jgi:hypothetical protein
MLQYSICLWALWALYGNMISEYLKKTTGWKIFQFRKMPTGLTAIPSLTDSMVKKVSPIFITPE